MKMVLLDGLDKAEQLYLTNEILTIFEKNNIEVAHFQLKDMNLLPCSSCGSCGLITPGKCVLKDDIEVVMKAISNAQGMVFITPIRFGGYCSTLKKVIDRFMLLGLPLYIYEKGHLLHPTRYDLKWLIGIGIDEKQKIDQIKSFEKLVSHNALNMSVKHKTLIVNSEGCTTTEPITLDKILKEVSEK